MVIKSSSSSVPPLTSSAPLTLTVDVDEKAFSAVRIYGGEEVKKQFNPNPYEGIHYELPPSALIDERTLMLSEKSAKEIKERTDGWWLPNYIKLRFVLKPGHYFVEPIARDFYQEPREVWLAEDTEIEINQAGIP